VKQVELYCGCVTFCGMHLSLNWACGHDYCYIQELSMKRAGIMFYMEMTLLLET